MKKIDQTTREKQLALITGATGGLGKAFVVECASRGWDIFMTDRSQALLDTLSASMINSYGIKVYSLECDLTGTESRMDLIDHLHTGGYQFTMLINVAGVDHEGRFMDQSSAQIQSIVRLNIESTLAMIHAVMPLRNLKQYFRIINVASLAAFYPMPVKAAYAASKRFLLDFSRALQEEMRGSKVTVTALCPAGMPTNLECIRAIEAQGWAGQITTLDVGRVANETINAAIQGKGIVIPGLVNRILKLLGSIVPDDMLVRLIGRRWATARKKRVSAGTLQPA